MLMRKLFLMMMCVKSHIHSGCTGKADNGIQREYDQQQGRFYGLYVFDVSHESLQQN
jgi:hypothetical protein